MALIVDAGPLVALADGRDARHEAVRAVVESTHDLLVLSPFVLAEADCLISRDLGMGLSWPSSRTSHRAISSSSR